jgi:hypothetical protein
MGFGRIRLYIAGLVALLVGMPLTEKAFAGVSGIVTSAVDLAWSIVDLSGGES